jgi:hypothetical protein
VYDKVNGYYYYFIFELFNIVTLVQGILNVCTVKFVPDLTGQIRGWGGGGGGSSRTRGSQFVVWE